MFHSIAAVGRILGGASRAPLCASRRPSRRRLSPSMQTGGLTVPAVANHPARQAWTVRVTMSTCPTRAGLPMSASCETRSKAKPALSSACISHTRLRAQERRLQAGGHAWRVMAQVKVGAAYTVQSTKPAIRTVTAIALRMLRSLETSFSLGAATAPPPCAPSSKSFTTSAVMSSYSSSGTKQ